MVASPNTPNTKKTIDINELVKIDENFLRKGYMGDYIICHSICLIVHAEDSNKPYYEYKKGDKVKEYAIALGQDSGDYHEAEYDTTIDYESVEKFIGEAFGQTLVTGYGLLVGVNYEVKFLNEIKDLYSLLDEPQGITFKLTNENELVVV